MQDAETTHALPLQTVRRMLDGLGESDRTAVSTSLVELAGGLQHGARLTIDATATAELGAPLLVLHLPSDQRASTALEALTPREREVALLLARGLSNRDIAADLTISISTAKDHVHNVLSKLACPSRAALAALLNKG